MSESSEVGHLSVWVAAVARELGLGDAVETSALLDTVLDLASEVTGRVSREGAPVTAFLVGVAAGRAEDPAVAARDYAERLRGLAASWDAEGERGVPAHDQSQRG